MTLGPGSKPPGESRCMPCRKAQVPKECTYPECGRKPHAKGLCSAHYVNGQRSDNRPENLELWVVSQPPGQRVDDLVSWARSIIATYGDLELPSVA